MSEAEVQPEVEVDAKRFDELRECYSGDLLGRNKCKTVVFANRLWTVTGTVSGGNDAPSVQLHELVPRDRYQGATGPYPFDSDGIFYKGQVVTARGRSFVMSGRKLIVVRKDDAPENQLDLLGWREAAKEDAKPKPVKTLKHTNKNPKAAKTKLPRATKPMKRKHKPHKATRR
jgi:hypothetical protein